MIPIRKIEIAYEHFIIKGFAGKSTLQREGKFKEYDARIALNKLVDLGIVSEFNGNEKQKVLITDQKLAKELINQ